MRLFPCCTRRQRVLEIDGGRCDVPRRNVIVRVRNERTTYLMHLLGYELGQSTADFTARLWDWEGNVAKYCEACDEIVR